MDNVLHWNEALLEANRLDHTFGVGVEGKPTKGPTGTSRAFAMVHLAMYDAERAIATGTAPYTGVAYTGPQGTTERDAAITAAAYGTLIALWPEFTSKFAERALLLPKTGSGAILGREIAATMLSLRVTDGSDQASTYMRSAAYGHHREDPITRAPRDLGAAWGDVDHFLIAPPGGHVPLDPPPGYGSADFLSSLAYARDHDEVRAKGSLGGSGRTPTETLIGIYWAYDGASEIGTPPRLYNQIVRVIAQQEHAALSEDEQVRRNAELFARVNVAMADACIDAWHWKYRYDLWRPVVGIREAMPSNGPAGYAGANEALHADPFWKPLGAPASNPAAGQTKTDFTPPFPAYPSGHATFGAATFQVLRMFLGGAPITTADVLDPTPDPELTFAFVSDELNGVTRDSAGHARVRHVRRFDDLVTPIRENSESRIYLGVHWRFDGLPRDPDENVGGVPLGLEIGRLVATSPLTRTATALSTP